MLHEYNCLITRYFYILSPSTVKRTIQRAVSNTTTRQTRLAFFHNYFYIEHAHFLRHTVFFENHLYIQRALHVSRGSSDWGTYGGWYTTVVPVYRGKPSGTTACVTGSVCMEGLTIVYAQLERKCMFIARVQGVFNDGLARSFITLSSTVCCKKRDNFNVSETTEQEQ